jgi:hypothetical protein
VVFARAAINPTPKFGRRSMARRRYKWAADAWWLADRLNDRTGLAGALRLGGNAAWRWDEGTADSGRLAAG